MQRYPRFLPALLLSAAVLAPLLLSRLAVADAQVINSWNEHATCPAGTVRTCGWDGCTCQALTPPLCPALELPPSPLGCRYDCATTNVWGACPRCSLLCMHSSSSSSSSRCPIRDYPAPRRGCWYNCTKEDPWMGCPVCTLQCSWQSSSACTRQECGPALGMPNWICPDGSTGGPACERRSDGTCGYVVHQCASSSSSSRCTAVGSCRGRQTCPAGSHCTGMPLNTCLPMGCAQPLVR